jgi:hypothetical protein
MEEGEDEVTLREKMIVEALAGYFVLALCAGVPFGIWQDSWAAGFFMTFFVFILSYDQSEEEK